jgi:cytochrome c2
MNNVLRAGLLVLLLAGAAEVVTHRTAQPGAETTIKHGEALFRTKGCITCHAYSGMDQPHDWDASIGPNLTTYRNDPAFLQRWLAEPSAVRADTRMPDLELAAPEIEALIAFLNDTQE